MKINKKMIMLGLSVCMFQSLSYASEPIPNEVFANLSSVIDSIEKSEVETETPAPNPVPEVTTGALADRIKYTRDRNSATMTFSIAGLENAMVKVNGPTISIALSNELLQQNGLSSAAAYNTDKNDRLVQNIAFESGANSNYLLVYLKDNVDAATKITASGIEISLNKKIPAVPKIVIDPGHGGKDPGAYGSTTNTQEKTIALKSALLLRDTLAAKGYDVTMTRDADWYPELKERSALANNMDADAFISIHYNSAVSTAAGIETFAYFTSDNKRLAENIQSELIAASGAKNRGVKNGNKLIVLNTTKVPAVLIELGFLSNPGEAKRLQDNDYQNTLAQAIARGIDTYFGR